MEHPHEQKETEALFMERVLTNNRWKSRYPIFWCPQCDVLAISCPDCDATSCNCQSCEKCSTDIDEFHKTKHCVESYMNDAERRAFEKVQQLKKHITECLYAGYTEINWDFLEEHGHLCLLDYFLFEELKKYKEQGIAQYLQHGMQEVVEKNKERI